MFLQAYIRFDGTAGAYPRSVAQCSTLALLAKIKLDQNVPKANTLGFFCPMSFNAERYFHKIDNWGLCYKTNYRGNLP